MGKLAEIKTKETELSVEDFINSVQDEKKRKDAFTILEMLQKISGETPKIWGSSIIGYGKYRYKSPATGREVDWFKIGFSPRKANISLYLGLNVQVHSETLQKLGKHKTGAGCLYVNKLADIDLSVLEEIITTTFKSFEKK